MTNEDDPPVGENREDRHRPGMKDKLPGGFRAIRKPYSIHHQVQESPFKRLAALDQPFLLRLRLRYTPPRAPVRSS